MFGAQHCFLSQWLIEFAPQFYKKVSKGPRQPKEGEEERPVRLKSQRLHQLTGLSKLGGDEY